MFTIRSLQWKHMSVTCIGKHFMNVESFMKAGSSERYNAKRQSAVAV